MIVRPTPALAVRQAQQQRVGVWLMQATQEVAAAFQGAWQARSRLLMLLRFPAPLALLAPIVQQDDRTA